MHVVTQDTENNAITRNTGDITDAARSPETLKTLLLLETLK